MFRRDVFGVHVKYLPQCRLGGWPVSALLQKRMVLNITRGQRG